MKKILLAITFFIALTSVNSNSQNQQNPFDMNIILNGSEEKNFYELINSNAPALVVFFTGMCGPCYKLYNKEFVSFLEKSKYSVFFMPVMNDRELMKKESLKYYQDSLKTKSFSYIESESDSIVKYLRNRVVWPTIMAVNKNGQMRVFNSTEMFELKEKNILKNEIVNFLYLEKSYEEKYENGSAKAIGKLKENQKQGEWKYYYENGNLKQEVNYIEGIETGEFKYFFENGQLQQKGVFVKGKPEGIWSSYYQNGEVELLGDLQNGKKTGEWKSFYDNGKLKWIGNFNDDVKEGQWQFLSLNGKIEGIVNYKNDLEIGERIYNYDNYRPQPIIKGNWYDVDLKEYKKLNKKLNELLSNSNFSKINVDKVNKIKGRELNFLEKGVVYEYELNENGAITIYNILTYGEKAILITGQAFIESNLNKIVEQGLINIDERTHFVEWAELIINSTVTKSTKSKLRLLYSSEEIKLKTIPIESTTDSLPTIENRYNQSVSSSWINGKKGKFEKIYTMDFPILINGDIQYIRCTVNNTGEFAFSGLVGTTHHIITLNEVYESGGYKYVSPLKELNQFNKSDIIADVGDFSEINTYNIKNFLKIKPRLFDPNTLIEFEDDKLVSGLDSLLVKFEFIFPNSVGVENLRFIENIENKYFSSKEIKIINYDVDSTTYKENNSRSVIIKKMILYPKLKGDLIIEPLNFEFDATMPTNKVDEFGGRIYKSSKVIVKSESRQIKNP